MFINHICFLTKGLTVKVKKKEFVSRGLAVHTVDSRQEFIKDIRKTTALHNLSGKPEITVVNIHKFSSDSNVVSQKDYNISIQRIYFLDEVHRSYNPKGSFLANLSESDKNAITIGLTGTPLIGEGKASKQLFGNYIHKYYYNKSIADGYTLRLMREDIQTKYRMALKNALKEIEVLAKDLPRKKVFAHEKYVAPMLDYIVEDFEYFRLMHNDATVGAMVVCDSSDQAKKLFKIFEVQYGTPPPQELPAIQTEELSIAAEPKVGYLNKKEEERKVKKAALILHDIGSKQDRKDWVEDFKDGKIDLLFVYNMLLTGFDAKRLKKLYLARVIKSHNLLQTLTRVNRKYKDYRYGFVVDFADIRQEFKATNEAYFNELQEELGDEMEHYTNIFKSTEEIAEEIEELEEVLFRFDTDNLEIFSEQISRISDRKQMLKITKALNNAKSLYNLIRLFGHYELLEKVDFRTIFALRREANNHLQLLNDKEAIAQNVDATNLLNVALEDVVFLFTKMGEEEMKLADELKTQLRKTREGLSDNFDKKDPAFITLYEALENLFKNKKLNEVSQEEMTQNIHTLKEIHDKIKELNRQNDLLRDNYKGDTKYARTHKRVLELGTVSKSEVKIKKALLALKEEIDKRVLINSRLLENEGYFEVLIEQLIIEYFEENIEKELDVEASDFISRLIVKEYLNEFYGRTA